MTFAEIVKRFDALETEGHTLWNRFGDSELSQNKKLTVAWDLAATNLLDLAFHEDEIFCTAYNSAESFAVKVEVIASAGKEFAGGFAGYELRMGFLKIAFADLSNEAQSLLNDGFLRCSAVVSRVALERHLRELAMSRGISNAETKKPALINQDLLKAKVYTKGVWSEIESWLTIGNEAAHAPDFDQKYSPAQVQKAITGIKGFIAQS